MYYNNYQNNILSGIYKKGFNFSKKSMESELNFISHSSKRYIENIIDEPKEYKPESYLKANLEKLEEKLEILYNEFTAIMPPDAIYKVYSNNKKRIDYSMYTGTGGSSYVYWRYFLYKLIKTELNEQENIFQENFKCFELSLHTNLQILQENKKSGNFDIKKEPTAFFHGPLGLYTMTCIYYITINEKENFKLHLNEILDMKKYVIGKYSEDELLYGNSGYLYSLLLLKKEIKKSKQSKFFEFDKEKLNLQAQMENNYDEFHDLIDPVIYDVVKFLHIIGKEKKKAYNTSFLIYPFNRMDSNEDPSTLYLGAAHGLAGVLYMLLSSVAELPNYFDNTEGIKLKEDILSSLIEINKIKYKVKNKNFPPDYSHHQKVDISEGKDKVQFCHGAPGFISLYLLAWKIYQIDEFLNIALELGELVWKKGILKKGFSLCHGITGNAYFLYTLYRYTNNKMWLQRFFDFSFLIFNTSINNIISTTEDSRRYVVGVPDTPYSLMEGMGGTICLFSEILATFLNKDKENYIYFPGYELL